VFLRSFIDFDGLTADEILARLFLWWFGPGFLALVLRFLSPTMDSYIDASSAAGYAGVALTGLVVFRDASRVGITKPWLWAIAAAVIPLIGWWGYGRVRAPDRALGKSVAIADYPGRPSALSRYANPFWQVKQELLTGLSPEECATRLNAVRWNWLSPRQWFALHQERPVQGNVSPRGFSLRWRHAMTRPGLLTEASARFETQAGATRIRLRLGQSVLDRLLVLIWLAIALLAGVPLVMSNPAGAPDGFAEFWLIGWIGLFLVIYLFIRTVSRDDDVRLRRLILQVLEAEDAAPR